MTKDIVILDALLEGDQNLISELSYEDIFACVLEFSNQEGISEEILNLNLSLMSIFLTEASDGYDVSRFGYGFGNGDGNGYGYGDGYGDGDGYGYGDGYGLRYGN